jgi:glutathione synthase/RimK-type ligase-like ATP-grasp enzyme
MNDYLPYPKFRSIRNRRNRYPDAITDFNYICILQDKFVFSQLLLSLGVPTPKVLAFCKPDKIFWLDDMKPRPIQALCESDRRFDGFCKPLMGTNGRGAFPLRVTEGQVYIGSNKATAGEIRGRINGLYLIQERISQHSAMSALHPQSLNTMRVVTFNTGDRVSVFSAAQRVGTNGRQVDNWSAGGILIGVELKTGRLRADGFYKPGYGSKVQEHPQTGVRFLGFEIPYFREALELVLQVHEYFYGVHSIGWDIAISERGPVIIEANDDWDGAVAMALERNFRKRFFEMFLSTTNPIFGPD